MEVPNIPKNLLHKADDPSRIAKNNLKKGASAYKAGSVQTDQVSLSSQAKELQKLAAKYNKLEQSTGETVETRKSEFSKGTLHLSSEEIVVNILKGTLFDIS